MGYMCGKENISHNSNRSIAPYFNYSHKLLFKTIKRDLK